MSSVERLDKYHKAILQYVKERPGQTENQIVKEMHDKKISSLRTTLKKIAELKEMGEIEDLLKEGESGFHKIYISKDKSLFNQINEKLVRIENVIDKMNNVVKNIQQKNSSMSRTERTKDARMLEAHVFFFDIIYDVFDNTLHLLLRMTNENISSEKDSKILYDKIIRVLSKVRSGYTFQMKLDNIISARFGKITVKDWIESLGVDKNLINEIIESARSLEKEFLAKREQKHPHEK